MIPIGMVKGKRRIASGGGTGAITHGDQLTVNHVGPWTLQGVAKGSEVLSTALTAPSRGYFTFDTPSEFVPAGTYVYNNDPNNHGGTVPAGGLTIDGYFVPAGVSVVQFYDMPVADFYARTTSFKVLFRGCRFRWPDGTGDSGLFNDSTAGAGQNIFVHYCDIGLTSKNPTNGSILHIKWIGGSNHRALRNYMTYSSTFIQPNVSGIEIVENWIDDAIYAYGELGPSGTGNFLHLNGCSTEGGLPVLHILRNHIMYPSPDGATGGGATAAGQPGYGTQPGQTGYGTGTAPGRIVSQTDCIALFTSNGTQWSVGTDVQVRDNLVGGSGFPFYCESSSGQQANVKITGNKVSTKWWTDGGGGGDGTGLHGCISWGTSGQPIVNGVNGCELSNNTWADDYGTGGNGTTAIANRQYPLGNGPRKGTLAF